MKISEQSAQQPPEYAPLSVAEPSEDEQYRQHVASLFTAPFLTGDALLENLSKYWPGDAHENLIALVAAGYVEVAPTGRYRLPLPTWAPRVPAQDDSTTLSVLPPVVASPVQPAPAVRLSVPTQPSTVPTPVLPTAPKFKPLRLAVPGRAA
ncbi:hypothetical protein [Hymenobacter defluvii]|uniref:Uncharacterized protein n=1 Tax=Hymenobacter defluvii TaxID=2054411 RepID=A0ABS3THT1_9BACT|nr:hypothetical protein [Hymenobacter defluvii]MBO3273205.1 hypothetical protein [Hymenobacter defluvii]